MFSPEILQEMKRGFVIRYEQNKSFGIICDEGGNRYYFHKDKIAKGPINPRENSLVLFCVSNRPVPLGRLPYAFSIVILDDITTGSDSLADAGQIGEGGGK